MRRFASVLAMFLILVVCACGVKSKKITESNKESVFHEAADKLSDEERGLLTAYFARSALAASFGATNEDRPQVVGKTIGQVITDQRIWVAQQQLREAAAKREAAEAKAREEAMAAAMRQAVKVTLTSKEFEASDWQAGRAGDRITAEAMIQNTGSKDISAFRGFLVLTDSFGDRIAQLGIKHEATIKAGQSAGWSGSKRFNQFIDEDVKLRNADLAKVKVEWRPTTILFTDGTRVGKE